ncbi:TonB-dependent receptor [Granulicella pectinivorans]|nr:carboxypeptidase regulatory-like domain-containing protein [Granulicella pectinivorans]
MRAQVANNTALVGTVTDASGGVVAGAKVVGTNVDTKIAYPGVTNAEGYYSIPYILPGTYDITVEKTGFQKTVTKGVIVSINVAVRTDAALKVGSESTELTVTADNPPLSTDDALLGETVNAEQVHDLPTQGRQALQLAATASNITVSSDALTGNPPGNRASGAGTRNITNVISLDGISLMNNLISTAFIVPNSDALDAVQTQNGNYTAQYGDYLGVHINQVTRSGTNKFHGTVYDYVRNDGFNARSWLQAKTVPKSQLRYNLFGGVVSGPIWKDKAFFLGSYEGLRNHGATSTTGTVLTNRMRTGDFGELCTAGFVGGICASPNSSTNKQLLNPITHVAYANNMVPVDPISAKILPYLTTPNIATTYSLANPINWQGNLPNAVNSNANLERVDFNPTEKDRIFARFAMQTVSNYSQAINLANTAYTNSRGRNGVIGYTRIITPNIVNDLHLGFNTLITQIVNQQYQTGATSAGSALGIPGFTADVDSGNPGLVDMSITGYQGIGQSGTNWFQDDRTLTLYDQISYTHNKHAFMAGVSFRKFTIGRSAANTARGQFTFDTTLLQDPSAAFIGGFPTGLTSPLFQVKGSIGQWRDGFFIQDNWQLTQKLTLQLGLRYELPQAAYSLNGVGRILDPTWTSLYPAAGGTNPLTATKYPGFKFSQTDKTNISPRLGFAYRVLDKTTIRGGGGIYYNANQMNSYTLSSTNYPYSANITNSNCLPNGTSCTALKFTLDNPQIPALTAFGLASNPYSAFTVDNHLPTQRMYQWNLDIGQEVWKNGGFELQYLGSHSIHLDESYYPNQPAPSTAFSNANRPNPNIGNIRVIHNDATAFYNGFTAILRQRLYHGLTANLSYTWSHALDEGDSSNDGGTAMWQGHLKLDYGNSGYDIRNRFVGVFTYALPTLDHKNIVLRETLGGWQANAIVDLRTGAPINYTLSTDYAHVNGVGAAQRPNFVHVPYASTCSRATVTGPGGSNHNSCLDKTAFASPANGTFGNLHRNASYGPGGANVNASLFKSFPIWEQVAAQIRVEAFNMFNHPNPSAPNANIESASFGYITSAQTTVTSTGARVLQIAGKINF